MHGFTWREADGFATLDLPGSPTGVRGMNERAEIIGIDDVSGHHGFLLRDGGVLQMVDYPGSVDNKRTLVIDNSGVMAGGLIHASGGKHGFVAR